jgi:hypothetical protein
MRVAAVRRGAVLEQEDALPSAELQPSVGDGDAELGLGQRALDVGLARPSIIRQRRSERETSAITGSLYHRPPDLGVSLKGHPSCPFGELPPARGKNVACDQIGLLKLRFRGTLSRTFQRRI